MKDIEGLLREAAGAIADGDRQTARERAGEALDAMLAFEDRGAVDVVRLTSLSQAADLLRTAGRIQHHAEQWHGETTERQLLDRAQNEASAGAFRILRRLLGDRAAVPPDGRYYLYGLIEDGQLVEAALDSNHWGEGKTVVTLVATQDGDKHGAAPPPPIRVSPHPDLPAGCGLDNAEARALWRLIMVSDPWPLTEAEHRRILRVADREAQARGYESWEVAYHEFREVGE